MLRSLFSAVSGLQAHQEMMDVIGNNIANINTDGYKSNSAVFEDLLSQTLSGASAPTTGLGGINPSQVGLGVEVAGTEQNMTQGALEQTGRNLDVAINGDGFLIGQSAANGTVYTRAGSLNVDANGNLVDPNGNLIQGWQANPQTGVVNTNGPVGNIQLIAGAPIPATATGNSAGGANAVTLSGNIGTTVPTINGVAGTFATTSVTVYDSLGNADKLTLTFDPQTFTPGTGGTVAVTASLLTPGTTVPTSLTVNNGPLTFGPNGTLTGGTNMTVTMPAGFPNAIGFNLSGVTATSLGTNQGPSIAATQQNGFAAGTLQTYNISSSGVINGVYSNGLQQPLGQIALANFANPAGLSSVGSNGFQATANSGVAVVGTAGTGGRGVLSAGTLEMSNVDLADQFTKLIEAQRGFEANSKVVTTSDQVLQALIAMKQ